MKEKLIGMELRSLNNLIMRYIENSAIKKQVDKITGTNGWIIGYIAEHSAQDIYQKDLEKRFSITRSTASKVLTLMERKGLIERKSVPQDARLRKIVLTQRAWDVSEMMTRDANHLEEILLSGFAEEELSALFCYIEKMKCNVKENLK